MIIEKNTIGEVWLEAVEYVLKNGKEINYRETELLEVLNLQLIINKPNVNDEIVEKHGDKDILEYMKKNFETDENVGFGYTYRQRFFDYQGLNQIENSLANLEKRENSMDAIFSTLMPKEDATHVPCLAMLQYIVRDETLIITVTFKSQDIGKKSYADYIEITKLFEPIKEKLDLQKMKIITNITSAHIYKDDIEKLKKLR
ncbi:MAG: thymidylate synthase [Patescibacteria group bacterium]|nr:thymidylate synthase [Patescibacteria group bacterium]